MILAWAWRIPFLLSLPLTIAIGIMRRAIKCSPMQKSGALDSALHTLKRSLFKTVPITSFLTVFSLTLTICMPFYLLFYSLDTLLDLLDINNVQNWYCGDTSIDLSVMVFAPKTFIWCNINFTIIAGITISPLRALSRDESGLYVSNCHLGRNSPIGEYLDDSKNRPTVISRLLHHALRAAGAACGVEIKNGGRLSGTPKPTEILFTFSRID